MRSIHLRSRNTRSVHGLAAAAAAAPPPATRGAPFPAESSAPLDPRLAPAAATVLSGLSVQPPPHPGAETAAREAAARGFVPQLPAGAAPLGGWLGAESPAVVVEAGSAEAGLGTGCGPKAESGRNRKSRKSFGQFRSEGLSRKSMAESPESPSRLFRASCPAGSPPCQGAGLTPARAHAAAPLPRGAQLLSGVTAGCRCRGVCALQGASRRTQFRSSAMPTAVDCASAGISSYCSPSCML